MPLKARLTTLEEAEEAYRDLYRQIDPNDAASGFVLDVEPVDGFELDDVKALKAAVGASRAERDDARNLLKAFDGIDPAKAKTALKKVKEFESIDPEKEADKLAAEKIKAIETQLHGKYEEEIAKASSRADALQVQVEKLLKTDQIITALKKHGGHDLLGRTVADFVKVKETDQGTFLVEVVDERGHPRIKNAKGDPMTVDDLVAEMRGKNDFAQFFKAPEKSGGGAPPNGGGGGTPPAAGQSHYSLDAWRAKVASAQENERKDLLRRKAAGEITVT